MLDAENTLHQPEAVGNSPAEEGLCAQRYQDTRKSPWLKVYLICDHRRSVKDLGSMYRRGVCKTLNRYSHQFSVK